MENGIMLNGKAYPVDSLGNIFEMLADLTAKKIVAIQVTPEITKDARVNYTVAEVAAFTRKSPETITRHCRLGLLRGHKVGKSWIIPRENFERYILASRTSRQSGA